jgi:hypothetical protein
VTVIYTTAPFLAAITWHTVIDLRAPEAG